MTNMQYQVALYYRYVDLIGKVEDVIENQEKLCKAHGLFGRIRISEEGINGTVGGLQSQIQKYIDAVEESDEFRGLHIDWKRSDANELPFEDLLIRRVKEIVSIELPEEECAVANTGTHLTPQDFDTALKSTPNSAIIDVRNNYEYNIGHFKDAMNPSTRRFGQFPQWVRDHLPELQQKEKILMYCTGGIRCEKASSYLKHLGLTNVYQLQGGIHRYLEAYPDGGEFIGKNFVFDQRVAMASSNEEVVGQCENCGSAHDAITGIRCRYCRMHVMLCSSCTASQSVDLVLCNEHRWMGEGSVDDLTEKLSDLEAQLTANGNTGPKGKGRRRSIRKQMDAIECSLKAIHITP